MTVIALGRNARTFGGESVVVERVDSTTKRIVVDLGRSTTGLYVRAVQACPDVVVLTHDDNDHIGGAATALGQLAQQCDHPMREVWLPADWLLALLAFAAGVQPDLADAWLDEAVSPEDLTGDGERPLTSPPPVSEEPDGMHPDRTESGEKHWTDDDMRTVLGAVERAVSTKASRDAAEEAVARHVDEACKRWGTTIVAGTPKQIAARASRSIKRIRAIAAAARECGHIRWFSPDLRPVPNPLNPHRDELVILNAGEVRPNWRPTMANPLAVFLQMVTVVTIQNERALVTVVQPTGPQGLDQNGVIVWSDSAGEGYANPTTAPWTENGLMTAPHHGSTVDAHQKVWDERACQAPATVVLLSNNSEKTTDEYTKLCGQHACTHCPTAPTATRPGRDAVAHWCDPWRSWDVAEL